MKHGTKVKRKMQSEAGKRNGHARVRRGSKRRKRSPDDSLFSGKDGFYDSGPPDLVGNLDKYLTAIVVYEHERGKRR